MALAGAGMTEETLTEKETSRLMSKLGQAVLAAGNSVSAASAVMHGVLKGEANALDMAGIPLNRSAFKRDVDWARGLLRHLEGR